MTTKRTFEASVSFEDIISKDHKFLGSNRFYDIDDYDYFDSEILVSDRIDAAIRETCRKENLWLLFNGLEVCLGLNAYLKRRSFTELEHWLVHIAACGRAGISTDSLFDQLPSLSFFKSSGIHFCTCLVRINDRTYEASNFYSRDYGFKKKQAKYMINLTWKVILQRINCDDAHSPSFNRLTV